ncbi:TadE/TadG family type IV pilus assembly protein [Qipengyuania soli]|uniref:Pilus assembly protein n=1 Tax=Qipengyuania soli TaxID=2782568 RepID=A0A7S8F3M2_9SPHN|nr:TadE/TadG family type IV pilus assembly protein [Qipengyuania soli]QPC98470.1 pilus assembly protein [Qipengyuania soli]
MRAFVRCERGAAAGEMALLLPLLILMVFGAVEMGYYFYNQHQVVKGVRDGARFAARQSFVDINCTAGYTLPSATETAIKEVTRTGQPSGGTTRVFGWVNSNVTVAVNCPTTALRTGIYRDEPNAPVVTVSARVNFPSLFHGLGFLTNSYELYATQQAAVMGI